MMDNKTIKKLIQNYGPTEVQEMITEDAMNQ